MYEQIKIVSLTSLILFICMNASFLIYLYIALSDWYFMPQLSFWHSAFHIGPLLILVVGIYKVVVAFYAIGVSFSRLPFLHIATPALLAIALFIEIANNYVFWEVKTQITLGSPGAQNVVDMLMKYGDPNFPQVTYLMDRMQHRLRCCGGNGWQSGYSDYRNTPIGFNNSVPDSCCILVVKDCGCNLFSASKSSIHLTIFQHGCVEILVQQLHEDVLPWVSAFSGILIAWSIIELGLAGLIVFCVQTIWEKEHPPEPEEEEEAFSISQNFLGDESPYNYSRENMLNNFDVVNSPSSPSETMC